MAHPLEIVLPEGKDLRMRAEVLVTILSIGTPAWIGKDDVMSQPCELAELGNQHRWSDRLGVLQHAPLFCQEGPVSLRSAR